MIFASLHEVHYVFGSVSQMKGDHNPLFQTCRGKYHIFSILLWHVDYLCTSSIASLDSCVHLEYSYHEHMNGR